METYVGEIRAFAFGKIPKDWAPCNGQVLQIADNQKLFALINTKFGGNGTTTFALPNLNGRAAIGTSAELVVGAKGGAENVTLTDEEMSAHTHIVNASNENGIDFLNQNNDFLAAFYNNTLSIQVEAYGPYSNSNDLIKLNPKTVGFAGGDQPHENRMPYLAMNYCIATDGLFPMRS